MSSTLMGFQFILNQTINRNDGPKKRFTEKNDSPKKQFVKKMNIENVPEHVYQPIQ